MNPLRPTRPPQWPAMLQLLSGIMMSTSAKIWAGTEYKSEIDSKSVMVVCYAAMWSILFLDFSSCISSLRTQPLVLSVSNVTHSGHSHSNTSKHAIWCWTRWHRKQHRSGARRDTGAAYVSASVPKLHMFTCLNYTCNSEIRAYEFINSMNSYTTEFRGFMNSYTYEFISIWIHLWINVEFIKKLEFKYEFIKWLWIHIWIHGSQLFLTNEFSAIFINSYTN